MSFPRDEPVWLVGLPGAGKTTVGRQLARRLRREFVDLDERIAAAAGMDVPAIFRREGEAGFRRREERALRRHVGQAGARQVVALGGGIVCRKANRLRLSRTGVVLWLDLPVATARRRCAGAPGERPLTAVLERQPRRLARRLGHYEALGTRIDAGRPVAAVVRTALVVLLSRRIRPEQPGNVSRGATRRSRR